MKVTRDQNEPAGDFLRINSNSENLKAQMIFEALKF